MQRMTGGSGSNNGNYIIEPLTGVFSGGTATHIWGGSNANGGTYANIHFDSANSPNARTSATTSGETRTSQMGANFAIVF